MKVAPATPVNLADHMEDALMLRAVIAAFGAVVQSDDRSGLDWDGLSHLVSHGRTVAERVHHTADTLETFGAKALPEHTGGAR